MASSIKRDRVSVSNEIALVPRVQPLDTLNDQINCPRREVLRALLLNVPLALFHARKTPLSPSPGQISRTISACSLLGSSHSDSLIKTSRFTCASISSQSRTIHTGHLGAQWKVNRIAQYLRFQLAAGHRCGRVTLFDLFVLISEVLLSDSNWAM